MMKIHTTEALMKAEISRRSLMKTSALGSLALASSAFTLPFSQMVRAAEAPVEEKAVWSSCTGKQCFHSAIFPNGPGGRGSGRRESGLEFLHR
ncbi:twin-arginine translocation signal domain-containing protein [Escherichia coli]|nr:twin-arginine translocation signal domain-containing protein [Escherichia coli]